MGTTYACLFFIAPPVLVQLTSLTTIASKEWVIPAKPRPGRKPKKELNVGPTDPKDDPDEESSASRRVQNRAAQRAFRERKQTQLAELQARLHLYEQGEIERNVALQNIAKKMKEENEELRKENQTLRDKIALMEQDNALLDKDKKRAYDDISTSSPSFFPADNSANKRARVDEDKQEALLSPFPSSSSSLVSSPDVTSPIGAFSPGGSHSRHSFFPTPPPINDLFSLTATTETTKHLDGQDPVDSFTCPLCTPDAPCLCREVTVQQATSVSNNSHHQHALQSDGHNPQSIVSLNQTAHVNISPTSGMSILDNLPAFQAPVPIRRRTGTSRANPVFPVTPITTTSSSSASKCSGDPDNCMACADDNFGKAFCQAIGHTVNSTLPCIDCPKRTNQTDEILVGGCCGDISKCGSCGIAPIISSTPPSRGPETIPTDDAWRQLKSHPNVAFADLSLLAEVVARRSNCTGSRVVISPAPGSVTPDHNARPVHHEPTSASADQSVLLTDPHEHFHQRQRQRDSGPQLVPQHVLIECGRRRVKEVNADGVREALRLLDQKFAHMR
ncbi:hypothetical protein EV363DRAFT_1393054 [Boletus edulis]|nr:hypothetical protein EV363DRAFT_1393054 [Boletus edulis]